MGKPNGQIPLSDSRARAYNRRFLFALWRNLCPCDARW
jgi:hypothetical protein